MNRLLLIWTLLLCCWMMTFAQTGLEQLNATTTPDLKLERELVLDKILALKAQGLVPDASLYARLAELTPRASADVLDQGNDNCPATVISAVPYTDSGTTAGRVDDYHCAANTAPDVIYRYTPGNTAEYTISLCSGFSYDTRLELRSGGECPGTTQVACNDDYCALGSEIHAVLQSGVTYYIIVDGYSTGSGSYTLTVSGPTVPTGETCATAYPLTIPGSVNGNSCEYTHNYDATCPYSGGTARDVVYAYTPSSYQEVTFSLCSGTTNYDTKLYVYANTCAGSPVACNDDVCTAPNYTSPYVSRLECVPLYAGTTYYIIVDGYGTDCGHYTLAAELCNGCPPPPNDNCANVTPQPLPIHATGNNECATHDCEILYQGEGEVWHAFTLEYPATVRVNVCALEGDWGVFFQVLTTGCPCSDDIFATTSSWDNSCGHGGVIQVWENLPAGTYYYPVIHHDYNNSVGAYEIHITTTTPPPCQTDFSLTAPGSLQGNTAGAGDDCTINPGAEQMIAVTIPEAGEWTFSLCSDVTTYDAWLDLRSACCGGTLIASSDDFCGLDPKLECVELAAGTYYLNVEGYGSATGPWALTVEPCGWTCLPHPVVEFTSAPLPQSECAFICPETPTQLVIRSGAGMPPLLPGRPPIVSVALGCNPENTNCEGSVFDPATEFALNPDGWVWEEGAWYNHISGGPGSVCMSLEGFLAVELSSFTAVPTPEGVALNWSTAAETNNERFEIIRDNRTIAQVATQGNGPQGHRYTWLDRDIRAGQTYHYLLVSVDLAGLREALATQSVTPESTPMTVTAYALYQNYPNPFNPQTEIRFDLPEAAPVELRIYSALGQLVTTLLAEVRPAGSHTVAWNGRAADGSLAPSGLYVYQLRAGTYTSARKMLLMK